MAGNVERNPIWSLERENRTAVNTGHNSQSVTILAIKEPTANLLKYKISCC